MTNAEMIRNASDDELAFILGSWYRNGVEDEYNCVSRDGVKDAKKWLKEEAKDE